MIKCKDCQYWKNLNNPAGRDHQGECHRYAPSPDRMKDSYMRYRPEWPVTWEDYECGDGLQSIPIDSNDLNDEENCHSCRWEKDCNDAIDNENQYGCPNWQAYDDSVSKSYHEELCNNCRDQWVCDNYNDDGWCANWLPINSNGPKQSQ